MFPITQRFISGQCRPYRKLERITAIIIHWTANTRRGAGAMANRNYFNSSPKFPDGKPIYASAHFCVDSVSIVQCLPEDEVAYHVGSSKPYKPDGIRVKGNSASPNNVTIGIEMCVNEDGDFNITRTQTIELTRYLVQKYNISRINVLRHYDITGKDCPKMMIDNNLWNQFLNEVFLINTTPIENRFKVNVSELNVRSGPGTNFNIQRKIKFGDIISIQEFNGKWGKIGTHQWVHSDYIIENS
jgi:N-acetylmuramoyl-L-alanine amidase CwlA